MDDPDGHHVGWERIGKSLSADADGLTEQAALRRHFLTDGALGAIPDWYLLDRAAKRYGIAPWEFLERPAAWLQWANTAQNAENEAAEAKRKQEEGS